MISDLENSLTVNIFMDVEAQRGVIIRYHVLGGVWNKNYNGPIYYDGNAYTLTNGKLYSYYPVSYTHLRVVYP